MGDVTSAENSLRAAMEMYRLMIDKTGIQS